MSVSAGSVTVELLLRLGNYNASLQRAQTSYDKFARLVRRGLTIGGVSYGLKKVINEAATLEQKFAKMRRASDASDKGFAKLTTSFKQFAARVEGVKLDSLFEITTVGAKMGLTGKALDLFTHDMAKMRVAIDEADLPTEELANRILKLISVFHLGSYQAINVASALNALDLTSTASARDILDITARMAPMAAVMGLSAQKTMALATALKQAGVMTEVGGTAIMQFMDRMANQKSAPAFSRLAGVTRQQWFDMLARDPLEAIKAIEKGLEKMDGITAIRALDSLGLQGQRVRQALLGLGRVMDELNGYTETSENDFKNLNSVLRSETIMSQTLHSQWDKLTNNFRLTSDAIGTALLPIMKALANGMVRFMEDIRASIDRNKEAFTAWGKWVADIVDNVGAIWRNFPLYIDAVRVHILETGDQIKQFFINLDNIAAHFQDIFGKTLVNYFKDLGRAMGASLINGLTDMLVSGLESLAGMIPQWLATKMGMGDLKATAKLIAQGAAGSRLDDRAPVWGRGNKKSIGDQAMDAFRKDFGLAPGAGIFGNMPTGKGLEADRKIREANEKQRKESQNRRKAQEEADEEVRWELSRKRGGFMGPPELVRRRSDLVKLLRGGTAKTLDPKVLAVNAAAEAARKRPVGAGVVALGGNQASAVALAQARAEAFRARMGLRPSGGYTPMTEEQKAVEKMKEQNAANRKRDRAAFLSGLPQRAGDPRLKEIPTEMGRPDTPYDRLTKRQKAQVDAARARREERRRQTLFRNRGAVFGASHPGPVAPPPKVEADPVEQLTKASDKTNDYLKDMLDSLNEVNVGIRMLGLA